MGKLKFYLKDGEKVYTIKEKISGTEEKTQDAHYKFIKIRPREEINILK